LRFTNSIFEPLWNNKFIESILIQIKETRGVEMRGEFYEQTGAIRDILQNHALQLLALTTMEQPNELRPASIHKEKQKIFKMLRLFSLKGLENIEIGQNKEYRLREHVKKDSLIETYASLKIEINSPRWRGVPITLLTGKKLDEQSTDIIVRFKFPKHNLWEKQKECLQKNELRFNIQPQNHIELRLNFGFDEKNKCTTPINLKFGFQDNQFMFKDAYENALNDLQKEDQSIFLSSDEILLSWKFIDQIMRLIDVNRAKMIKFY
jgi:glucose-6-phosphate 1-dehydrogenase